MQGAAGGRITITADATVTTTTTTTTTVDVIAVAVNVGYVGGQQTVGFAVDGICQLRQRIDGK